MTCCRMPNGDRLACDPKSSAGCGCQCHWHASTPAYRQSDNRRLPYADLDNDGGNPVLLFVHECAWGEGIRVRKTQLPLGSDRWQVGHGPSGQLSVTPSIHCTACGLHGFFTDGDWR